jgi:hypothetical protein
MRINEKFGKSGRDPQMQTGMRKEKRGHLVFLLEPVLVQEIRGATLLWKVLRYLAQL